MTISTIHAIATPPGRSGVAVVRVSGPRVRAIVAALAGPVPAPRRASLRRLVYEGRTIDEALVLVFPAPASFTGEDVAEFHTHGSLAVLAALLAALRDLGSRPAEPGAFTRRALENGRLDLTQVEGLADLLDAETEAQRRQALALQDGALSRLVAGWIAVLTDAMARIEARIDFAEEGDVAAQSDSDDAPLLAIRAAMQAALAEAGRGRRVREGLRVVVAGPPNAGKSSLMNALAQADVAIVTDVPGTTRDALDALLDCEGHAVLLTDTAGLRASDDAVERIGIARARDRIGAADLVLWLGDTAPPADLIGAPVWHIGTKADMKADMRADRKTDLTPGSAHSVHLAHPAPDLWTSARTGAGLAELTHRLAAFAGGQVASPALLARERQRAHVAEAAEAVARALDAPQPEMRADDLRAALTALHRLTGRFDVEHVLDALFSTFCIGK